VKRKRLDKGKVFFVRFAKAIRIRFYVQNTPKVSSVAISKDPKKKKIPSTYRPFVPAVEQAARVLFCLAESLESKMTLTEVCKQVRIYKSKGHAILNTLSHFDLVEKDPQSKTYSLGPSLLFLSRNVLDNLSYPEVVAPFLQNLARETNGTAVFGLIQGDHVLVVGKDEGYQNIGFTLRLGHRFHLTLGAHGKAVVAFMREEKREKILTKKKLYFYGNNGSPVDMNRLRADLSRCREQGFAQDPGEITPGVNVVSAPVFALREKVVGCIILLGSFPEGLAESYGSKVANTARQISYKLGAHPEDGYRIPLPFKQTGGTSK
jgi:IclR family acetate operon transcriptional repressor